MTRPNKHDFAVSLKDSAREGWDNVGWDRDKISNVGWDVSSVPPLKGGTRKLWDLVFCLLSLVVKTRFYENHVNFERTYLHCLKEFWDVLGHFEYVHEHIFSLAVFLSTFI